MELFIDCWIWIFINNRINLLQTCRHLVPPISVRPDMTGHVFPVLQHPPPSLHHLQQHLPNLHPPVLAHQRIHHHHQHSSHRHVHPWHCLQHRPVGVPLSTPELLLPEV